MEDTAKNEITAISAAEGPCERGKADLQYWGLHPQSLRPSCLHVFLQASPPEIPDPAGRLMTTIQMLLYRGSHLPLSQWPSVSSISKSRLFISPLGQQTPPPVQCADYQRLRKPGDDCWKSFLLKNPNVDTCKAISLISQNPAIATP